MTFVLSAVAFFTLYYTAPRDVSWIGDTENYIKKENWEPGREYVPLQTEAFFLYEDGKEQYFYLYSERQFLSYINSLMDRVVRLLNSSIPEVTINEILATDKVLELRYRFPSSWHPQNRLGTMRDFVNTLFVLEDKIGMGLEGTIILREEHTTEPYYTFSVWEIPKLSLG